MVTVQTKDILKERDPITGKCFFTDYFEFEFKDEELTKMEKVFKKLWEGRKSWEPELCETILEEIKYERTAVEFDLNKTAELPEVVLEIARLIKKGWSWTKKNPPQHKLDA